MSELKIVTEWAEKNLPEYTDSKGGVDSISMIEEIQRRFGMTPRDAERAVNTALGDP